ncbi:histidine--tRNA ligase [Oceanivirga miroungae]|uniref:Histidine--tRNA ligase n=1 Tax=Oceanivirga miroungae TaxID=1130046 RepID=A0A6I8MA51_9FUSO|nr:histidine--tRNA ligase [Oceanivirga miroungae]VWL85700.1 histidyl-tRNA synthetase [Oceanivirga miroungae]
MQILKGMKDVFYEDMDKYTHIVEVSSSVLKKYGYSRISTPILEEYELFKRSSGEESDVVSKEMYDFNDKGDRHIALRPEGTAGIVRAYLENKLNKVEASTKWFYYGTMYRYEAPQKGRFREFNQIGIENFGQRHPLVDASIIKMGIEILEKLGLKDLVVEINSLGDSKTLKDYTKKLKEYLLENYDKLSPTSKIRVEKNPLRVLDSKEDSDIILNAPKIREFYSEESLAYFNEVLEYLEKMEVKYEINEKLVRGLDYYSDTVFEIKSSNLGAQSTVLAGGRYDRLLENFSGKKIPAIGFAAGIERLMLLLEEKSYKAKLEKVFIVYFDETKDYLFKVIKELENSLVEINYELEAKNFSNQMKKANKWGADKVIILGVDEIQKGVVSIKDFNNNTQEEISFDKIKEVK